MLSTVTKLYLVRFTFAFSISLLLVACEEEQSGNSRTLSPQASSDSPPVAYNGLFPTLEDTPVSGTLSASDADGDALTFSIDSVPTLGAVVITNPLTGAFTYTPNLNTNSSDTFTFVANDGTQDSNVATVTVNITPVNNPPVQCSDGLASQDLAGQCRATPQATMGALETPVSATASGMPATAQKNSTTTLRVTWNPYPGNLSGYMIYFGPSADATNSLASDLPLASGLFDPAAPMVIYDPLRDLSLRPDDPVCFRIGAYDRSGSLVDWSELVCTVVS